MHVDPREIIFELDFFHGQKVADFGSGGGHWTLAAAGAIGSLGRVYAVDRDTEALEHLAGKKKERGFGNIYLVRGDVTEVEGSGLKDNLVNTVILSNVLSKSSDPKMVAIEARRILKTPGKIIFVDRAYPEKGAEELFKELGFELKRRVKLGNQSVCMFARI